MKDPSPARSIRLKAIGLSNALLYGTANRRFLGFTIAGWLKFLSLVLILAAWLARWPVGWLVAALALAVALRLLYWQAKRRGYVTFVPTGRLPQVKTEQVLGDNDKLNVRATGLFSVGDREAYVLQQPAQYWRVPLGDHTLMVEQGPGRFLYQFVQPDALRHVEAGFLVYGLRLRWALAVTFLSSWGPKFTGERLTLYGDSPNQAAEKLEHRIYLTFDDEADRLAVMLTLRRDLGEATETK